MARTDPAELFNILDDGTGAGTGLTKAVPSDSPASKQGAMVLAFRDSSGNLVLPQLMPDGRLPVDTEGVAGTVLRGRGSIDAGSTTAVAVVTVALSNSRKYSDISFMCSCRQDSLFQVIWNNNGVQTILYDAIVGSGQFTFNGDLRVDQFTSGSTGTQQLIVQGNNFSKLSALAASISAIETT